MDIATYLLTALASYLLGSIPTGYLVARARGIDIRSVGSGNIGATNVFRILGKTCGIVVLLVDALKGFLACWGFPLLFMAWRMPNTTIEQREYLQITAGIAAVLGHNYTCWLRFKGGKGIATSSGVLIALFPKAFLVVFAVFVVVLLVSRYVSLASISAAAALPIAAWQLDRSPRMIVVATLLGVLAIYKHKTNIQRLLQGTENRIGSKKKKVAQ